MWVRRALRQAAVVPRLVGRRRAWHGTAAVRDSVTLFFHEPDGTIMEVSHPIGNDKTVLDAALAADVDIEAACGGECACSTCQVILDQAMYDSLDAPQEEELDMLDLAFDDSPTSRLCCQLKLTKEWDGKHLKLPSETSSQV